MSINNTVCTWCLNKDEHDAEEFCNSCEFCEAPICCECWDDNDICACYYPGEGYCPSCKKKVDECPRCTAYLKSLMWNDPNIPPFCDKHLNSNSPDYIGKT